MSEREQTGQPAVLRSGPHPTREQLALLVDALAEPVGPWVFVGRGGELATLRHEISQEAADPVRGVLDAEEHVESLLRRWARSIEHGPTLELLLELAASSSPEGRSDAWESALHDLLVAVTRAAGAQARVVLSRLAGHPTAGRVVGEVLEVLDDEPC